jgi:colicin import membrane protein
MNYPSARLLVVLACCGPLLATGQSTDPINTLPDPETQRVDAQRLTINIKRQQLESGFAAEDAVCYQRFAVNKCLRDVNARRMASMADLRRQDVLLNDQERKRRGADQIRRIEEKQTAASQQDLAERRAKVFSEYQSRAQAVDQRLQEKKPEADVSRDAAKASADRLNASKAKAQVRRDKQSNAPQEAERFNVRQVEAEKRRADHAKQQAAKPPSTAKTLPVPP